MRPPLLGRRPPSSPAGCFWCTEAVFLPLEGVHAVESGYIGGAADTANYQAVCSGTTGHAEAIRITFDPAVVSFGQLLKVFFSVAHDPDTAQPSGRGHRHAVPFGHLSSG